MKKIPGPSCASPLRKTAFPFGVFTLGITLAAATSVAIAQGPPGYDRHDDHRDDHHGNSGPYNQGHGGPPPPQYRNNGNQNSWRFRSDDRNHFYSHYRSDADRWRGRRRPVFVRGQAIPPSYRIQAVPQNYWQGAPPPPAGYQYGYYDGYVVAYNPTTRIIADVLDLVTAAATR